jgi:twitching motility two-component system response regulator PilH
MKHLSLKNLFTRSSAAIRLKERRQQPRSPESCQRTILIVDDSRTVVAAFSKVLGQAGFTTISANNGADGVAIAKQQQPDLILMDVVMPGVNGFQATRQIRKNESTSHIPIIIVSGEQQATQQFWGKRVGANAFLTKPVNRGRFFNTIFEALETAAAP